MTADQTGSIVSQDQTLPTLVLTASVQEYLITTAELSTSPDYSVLFKSTGAMQLAFDPSGPWFPYTANEGALVRVVHENTSVFVKGAGTLSGTIVSILSLDSGGGGGGSSSPLLVTIGAGAPSDGAGTDGDLYIDSETRNFYQRESGTWGSPLTTLGEHPAVTHGSGVPVTPAAAFEALYLDTSTGDWYRFDDPLGWVLLYHLDATTIGGFGTAALLDAGVAGGVASLDGLGFVPAAQLPGIAITDTFVVGSQAAMLALSAQTGDVAVRTDTQQTFILQGSNPATLGNWVALLSPADGVTSVGLSLPAEFTVTVSPITSTGTLTAVWGAQSAGAFLAAPIGISGTPAFRAIDPADLVAALLAPPAIGGGTPAAGAFTALSATGVITSTLATGTAPFTVASTTLVANLHAARAALADTVTTNANLTGPITSVGNATSVAAQTGTGTTFVMQASPTLTTPVIGVATGTSLSVSGALTSGALTTGRITTAGTAGLLQDFAGLAIVGTPSATAPNTGTNGPGLQNGIQIAAPDGAATGVTTATYGNSVSQSNLHIGYACQGTAASPGASIAGDLTAMQLRGHDGTNFTTSGAQISLEAASTWSPTNHESLIQFKTCPNGSTSQGTAMRIDSNARMVIGGAFNSIATYPGAIRPFLQVQSVSNAFATITGWSNGASGTQFILAKSRSGVVGTQGVITTGDTLGTLAFQGDDGTNFIGSVTITGVSTGTIATNQVPGILRVATANSSGTLTNAWQTDSAQVLVVGANTAVGNGVLAISGAQTSAKLQCNANTTAGAAMAQVLWAASALAPVHILAKSRSTTVNTQGVITTGDTLGTLAFQGDDGTNFIAGATISAVSTGTIATNQTPGILRFSTASSAGTMTLGAFLDSSQVWVVSTNATVGSTLYTGGTVTPRSQIQGTNAGTSGHAIALYGNSTTGGTLYFAKSRSGTIGTMTVVTAGDTLGTIDFQGADGTNFVSAATITAFATGTLATNQIPGVLRFSTASSAGLITTAALFDASQTLVIGNTNTSGQAVFLGGSTTPRVQVKGTSAGTSAMSTTRFTNDTGGSFLVLAKSRSATIDTMTVVTTGDTIGTLSWDAADGTNFISAARIIVTATGTPSAGVMPGNMVIQTAAAAGTLTTAVTIDNAQNVTFTANTDNTFTTGYGKLGLATSGTSTMFYVAQTSCFNSTDFALTQNASGDTGLNCKSGRSIAFRIGGASKMAMSATTFTNSLLFVVSPPVTAGGVVTAMTVTAAANTGQTASTEVPDVYFNLNRTVTWLTGAIATQRFIRIDAPTIAFASGTAPTNTVTTAATFAIGGAPIVGALGAITNRYSLWVQADFTRFDGRQFLNCANSAPTDADIPTAAVSWYLDEGGNNIKVRVRYADGTTLKTGTVALV